MAITISNLTNKKGANSYTFSDLHMDLEETKASANNRNSDVVNGQDIIADLDANAVRNFIHNFFTQKRYLIPTFGLNPHKYIGQPMSELGARNLGKELEKGIYLFEPRIKVEKIVVGTDYNTNSYAIAAYLTLQNLGQSLIVSGMLNSSGSFNFIN